MMPRTTIAISGILRAGFVIPAQAQLDTLGNGMSDVWERYYNNGELFDPENPDHHPDADPDGDGWTNMQEYIAGTDPFSANPPEGFIPTYITYLENQEIPDPDDQSQTIITDVAIISWDTIPGKTYTLWSSPDLTPNSWVMADGPVIGDGDPWASPILLSHAFEDTPERLFWRVKIEDPHTDSDYDGLTDYEEWLLGSDPLSPNSISEYFTDGWIAQHLGHIPNIFLNFNMNIVLPNGNGTLLENLIAGNDLESLNDVPELPAWTAVTSGKTSPSDDPAPAATRNKQVTVPAGTSVLLLVAIASEEFPEWTAPDAESNDFNDVLQSQFTTSTGATYADSYNVNEDNDNTNSARNFHKQWENAELIGQTLEGMCNVIHYAHIELLCAPDSEDLELDITVSAQNVHDNDLASDIAVGVIPVNLIPDWNRDGTIDEADYGKVTAENPWRFWINDDNDSGDTGGNDIPQGQHAPNTNSKNHKVDGIRDLVDFFPVFLDLKAVLEVLPPHQFRYRLTHPHPTHDPALRVVLAPQLNPESSSDYLKDLATAQHYQAAESGAIHTTGPLLESGLGLGNGMLDALANSQGLLLVEGVKHTTDPIILKIERMSDNSVVTEIPFHISISGVQNMFRHKNLRPYASSYNPIVPSGIDRMDVPANFPDELCNEDWFIFLHGYNVNEIQSWGWQAEAFKRLFWSGNKARFVGVSWFGEESQNLVGVTPKYHKNVTNALETAGHLAAFANDLEGGDKYYAAHSLGCLVTAHAIANEEMDAELAFLIDPALPTEALLPKDFASNDPHIEPAAWRTYPDEIKASDWYGLFPGSDDRSKLTWRGLVHDAAPKLKIFFSEGEEVLGAIPINVPADPALAANAPHGQYAFCIQAMLKGELGNEPSASQQSFGGNLASLLISAFASLSPATEHGGWRWTTGLQNPFYGIPDSEGGITKTFPFHILDTPESMARLRTDPVFGITTPPGCAGLFHETDGHDVAADPVKFRRILADMIPERTLPAGGAGGSGVEGSVLSLQEKFADAGAGEIKVFDMQEESNGWPNERTDMRWLHSDIREVAYTITWPAWQKIVTTAELDREP